MKLCLYIYIFYNFINSISNRQRQRHNDWNGRNQDANRNSIWMIDSRESTAFSFRIGKRFILQTMD